MKRIKSINEGELRDPVSRWVGNDASRRFHTIKLNRTKTRDLVLFWRRSKAHTPVFVGCYRLHIEKLIASGHCQNLENQIRITLFHDDDGWIRLRIRRADSGGLVVGGPIH